MTLAAGSRLGPYEILGQIGAGGMGEVYRAKDPRLGRDVAIKVLPASFSQDTDRLRRFEQEARAAGVLNHPNITAVYDFGTHDDAPYVVQELLEGETLRAAMAGAKLPPRKAIDYALQIAHGLAAAHEKGIVHRDLKPENLFVTNDGRVKILDFGLAKLTLNEARPEATNLPTATGGTEPGVVLGTLGYMSPEQVKGKPADARSDIFSFGAILYEMLSGRRAFHADSAAETMSAILREEPPDLSVTNQSISPGLERIVRHAIEKNPEQRFHSAHDVAFALEALSGLSTPRLEAPPARARVRSPIFAAAVGLAVALAAGLFAGRLIWKVSPPAPPSFTRSRRGAVRWPSPRTPHTNNNRNPTTARVLLGILTTFSEPVRRAAGPRSQEGFRSDLSRNLELSLGCEKIVARKIAYDKGLTSDFEGQSIFHERSFTFRRLGFPRSNDGAVPNDRGTEEASFLDSPMTFI
jgi:serine/threonine protein kinase